MRHSPAAAFAAAGSARASRPLRGSLERVGSRPLTGGRALRRDGSAGATAAPAAGVRDRAAGLVAADGHGVTAGPAVGPATDVRDRAAGQVADGPGLTACAATGDPVTTSPAAGPAPDGRGAAP